VRVRDLVGNALEAVIDEAGDLFDDRSYEALTALRVAVIEDLKARGGDLAQIVNRGFGGLQPALVLAYRLYRDATRADEVLARNDCAHPGFLPAQLELLAA
jgi:prophage DNA circulation protein